MPVTHRLAALVQGASISLASGEVSPDGQGHFPIVVEKLAQMHLNEPALTAADLSRITSRTLVMVVTTMR